MRGKRFLASGLGLLASVLWWCPVAGIAGPAIAGLAATNLPIVVRKMAPARQSPVWQSPGRLRNTAPQSELYFGSRLESVTSEVVPQNPYESNYASAQHSYRKVIIGFRLALTTRAYLFVGVGMTIPDDLLEQGLSQNVSITTAQIQNALGMQTEYGLAWDF